MTRTCQQCGDAFEPKRPHARFCADRCRAIDWRENEGEGGSERVQEHPLREAREEQEATDLKSKLSQIIYEGIVDRLKYGPVHADDLEPLFAPEVRDICRRLVGAQFGSLAARGYIVEKERRKSSVPTRKGAKSGVFVFTRKGREKLAGAGVETPVLNAGSGQKPNHGTINPEGTAASHSVGGTLDRPRGVEIATARDTGAGDQPISSVEGESGAGGRGQAEVQHQPADATPGVAPSEPTALFSEDVGRERPRSAFTDDELEAA